MHVLFRSVLRLLVVFLTIPLVSTSADDRKLLEFVVTYTEEVHPGPISARVYVMLGPAVSLSEPRLTPSFFSFRPTYAADARDWKPGTPLTIGPDALGFPGPLNALRAGTYTAQAVVRLNHDTHAIGDGAGNAFGPTVRAQLDPEKGGVIPLTVDQRVRPKPFKETDRIKLVDIPSPILSAFYHRPIHHQALVCLPQGDPTVRRPTLYVIPGFGGDHLMGAHVFNDRHTTYAEDMIRVMLNPDCETGHHVFADSATNGPRGRALVEELIPHLEQTFPAIAEPGARLLNGHSSGGWSSLWLQVTYPDTFGGTWSTSPDPVDFRDFQRIDIYEPDENVFRDRHGNRRPLARFGTRPILFYDVFSRLDDVIGEGGQLRSFEAVFSPLGPDGKARRLWDRTTGTIDPGVARAWEKYDIRLALERNWKTLGPKLAGKLHVVVGELDTFYLEGAVKLLMESLKALGSDAVVEIVPGRDHSNLIDEELAARFDREMSASVAKYRPGKAGNAPQRTEVEARCP